MKRGESRENFRKSQLALESDLSDSDGLDYSRARRFPEGTERSFRDVLEELLIFKAPLKR